METERLKRINELALKAKTVGLTPDEIVERDQLRKEYLAAFRSNLEAELNNTYVVDRFGNKEKLKRRK